MKIHYFKEGIKDDSFNSGKTTILVDRSRFPDFNSVMNLYSNFKRSQKNAIIPQDRTISAAVAMDVAVAVLFLKRKSTS